MYSCDILTPAELADRLRVPITWVYEHTAKGCGNPVPVLRVGRYLRFVWPDVEQWLRRGQQPAIAVPRWEYLVQPTGNDGEWQAQLIN